MRTKKNVSDAKVLPGFKEDHLKELKSDTCGRQQGPIEYALDTLRGAIANSHAYAGDLLTMLKPYLPAEVFADTDAENEKEDTGYAEHGSELTPVQIEIHKAINETSRLNVRLHFLLSKIVT